MKAMRIGLSACALAIFATLARVPVHDVVTDHLPERAFGVSGRVLVEPLTAQRYVVQADATSTVAAASE